jgi:hypothetical protein
LYTFPAAGAQTLQRATMQARRVRLPGVGDHGCRPDQFIQNPDSYSYLDRHLNPTCRCRQTKVYRGLPTYITLLIVNTHQPLASMSWSMHCMFAKINLRSADKVIWCLVGSVHGARVQGASFFWSFGQASVMCARRVRISGPHTAPIFIGIRELRSRWSRSQSRAECALLRWPPTSGFGTTSLGNCLRCWLSLFSN